ncbi:hypothetical protein XENORESO_021078, partial [Xenotaenia resolanae]
AFMRKKGCSVSRWTCDTVKHPKHVSKFTGLVVYDERNKHSEGLVEKRICSHVIEGELIISAV